MTDGALGLLQLFLFLFFIMLGFPIAFTLMAMGLFFGYLGMQERIFDLLVQRTYSVMSNDVLIAISNSGENDELLTIVPLVKRLGGRLIAITGNESSSLAHEADIHLDARVDQEACPLNLAPTASTTAHITSAVVRLSMIGDKQNASPPVAQNRAR